MDSLGFLMLRLLPPSLEEIEIPKYFHPSSFVELERCALSVLGVEIACADGLLTPHPTAYLGTVLHHVRSELGAGRWGGLQEPAAAVDAILSDALLQAEERLAADPETRSLVPLRNAVGRRGWNKRIAQIRRWAESLPNSLGSDESPRSLSLGEPTKYENSDGEPQLGLEQSLQVEGLRLRGRPDFTDESDNKIDVVDYKTGRFRDDDGRILESHRVQLQLYGLMLESIFGSGKRINLYLEQVERVRVPWSRAEQTAIAERLEEVSAFLPAGAVVKADSLAKPGTHCRQCRLRPVCQSYLNQAPKWWRGGEGNPRPLPLDVWGELVEPVEGGRVTTLRLLDPAGRRVRVDQVRSEHDLQRLNPGQFVWLFDLEASEDIRHHREVTHPRNFHEHPPGPRWRRATRLRVFSSL